eukprot:2005776-Rhodomonas_salina.4
MLYKGAVRAVPGYPGTRYTGFPVPGVLTGISNKSGWVFLPTPPRARDLPVAATLVQMPILAHLRTARTGYSATTFFGCRSIPGYSSSRPRAF